MAATLELRRRIRSIRSTRQITKAMELVAASKMRRATEATLASRPYTERSQAILQDLLNSDVPLVHPLLAERPVQKILVLAISSDRGLAGMYNSAVVKKAAQFAQENKAKDVSFIAIGRKVSEGLAHLKLPVLQSYPSFGKAPHPEELYPIQAYVIEAFTKEQFDAVYVIYTQFFSMLRQEAQLVPLLPLHIRREAAIQEQEFVYEPGPSNVLNTVLPRLIEAEIYQMVVESLASEQAARRIAMKNATDNAGDLLDDLTLTFNGIRQGAITQELAEISSGSAALAN